MTQLKLPEQTKTDRGAVRRAGLEIELADLPITSICSCICKVFGGTINKISPYEYEVTETTLGDFKAEFDFAYLKKVGREQADLPEDDLALLLTDSFAAMAANLVPFEVVCPPVSLTELDQIETLIRTLRDRGAKGTHHSAIFAFGMHWNIEPPALDGTTLLRYFRAFLCLREWLEEREKAPFARKVTPYIQDYPTDYIRTVVDSSYAPDRQTLIRDYLEANPSRNRMLDLLPLWTYLDQERVARAVQDGLTTARPAFHYRLPNSEVDKAAWGLASSWNGWLEVEALANDPERLQAVSKAYGDHLDAVFERWLTPWPKKVTSWLIDP